MTGLRLRTKFLFLLTLISLVPLVMTAVLSYSRFQSTLQRDAGTLENQLASTAAVEVKSFIVSQVGVLDTVATLYNPEFFSDRQQTEKIVENVLYKNDNFTDMAIVNKDGKEVLREGRIVVYADTDLRDLSTTAAFKTVKEQGVYVGPMYLEEGRAVFELGRWIADSQGNFSGAVFTQVDGKVMQQVTKKVSTIAGTGGRAYIVNDQGIVIAHPDISYVLSERDLSKLPAISLAISGTANELQAQSYYNENGENVLGSAYPITLESGDVKLPQTIKTGWHVIVEQPRSVIFAEADKVALYSIIILLVAVAVASGLAVFFARRISAPVEALYTATREFGKGNLVYRTKISSNDEIGDLARNFDSMAQTISKSIQTLQQEEEIVTAERDKLSLILSGITNAVVAVDSKRRIILFNKAAETLTGLKASEVTNKPIQTAFKLFDKKSELLPTTYCPIKTKVRGDEKIFFQGKDLKLRNGLGQERFVNLIAGTIAEGTSIQLGCILTFQDITREYIVEKTKSEFVSIAAHQLRTPLTGIKWSLQDLYNGESGPLKTEQKTMLGETVTATRRMIQLVNDLLDVSRIEEGRFGVLLKKQDLLPILERVKEEFHIAAGKKGITLKINTQMSLPQLTIDAEKIEIVLNNLLDNAIKYSSPGSEVELRTEKRDKEIVISVKDSGIGISPNEYDRVFSKFFRSKQALLYFTDGSGLGLYVSKNIVEQHGGKIWFESKEGQGSTFFISLPLGA